MFKRTASFALLLSSLLPAAAFAQDAYGYATGGYPSSASSNANYEQRFLSMEEQQRAITGKLEQLDHLIRRLDQSVQRMQGDYDNRLTKLETAPPPVAQPVIQPVIQPVVQPTQAASAAAAASAASVAAIAREAAREPEPENTTPANGQLGDLKVQNGHVTGAVNNPKATALPNKPDDYGLTPEEAYDRALGFLRQANYDDASAAFKKFIEKYPQDKQIENAHYWYGETFYVRGKFSDAAVAFAEAFQQNPKGVKAPDSLLKLGMSLGALGKTDDACATLNSLKKEFPKAAVATRARADQERVRLKCK